MTITIEPICGKHYITVTIGPEEDPFEKYNPNTFKQMFYDEVLTKSLLKHEDGTYALKVKDYTIEGAWGPIWCLEMVLLYRKNWIIELEFARLVRKFKKKYGS